MTFMNESDPNIPIKIKPIQRVPDSDIKKALNLNRVLSQAQKFKRPKSRLIWLVLTLIFLTTSAVLAIKTFWLDQKTFFQYQKLIPQDSQTLVIIKISQLNEIAPLALPELNQNNNYLWLEQRVSQFLSENQISAGRELWPLFKDEVAFLILPSNSSSAAKPAWGLLAQIKNAQDPQSQKIFNKIEQGLRKEFGINQSFYRQIKVNSVYSFNQINKPYYWSQINDYIAISNDLTGLQKMIDEIVSD